MSSASNAYFPITDKPDYDKEDIREGWTVRMQELGEYSERHNRQILFTELGYNQSYQAPIELWAYKVDGEEARPIQAYCMRTALAAIAAEPRVVGALLWKWFRHPRPVGRISNWPHRRSYRLSPRPGSALDKPRPTQQSLLHQ